LLKYFLTVTKIAHFP